MFRKVISIALVVLVLNVLVVSARNQTSSDDTTAAKLQKVKDGVRELGTGPNARIEVKLVNGKKVKGYVSEAHENDFVVIHKKSGATTTIDYAQVKELKGQNSLTAKKVAVNVAKGVLVVAAVAGAATLFMYLIVRASGDN